MNAESKYKIRERLIVFVSGIDLYRTMDIYQYS